MKKCPKCGTSRRVSRCCGLACGDYEDMGLCAQCGEHCDYVLECGADEEGCSSLEFLDEAGPIPEELWEKPLGTIPH